MKDRVRQLVHRFGPFKSQKGGSELIFRCPDCDKMKLSYNVAKNMFHPCWSCSFSVRLKRTAKRFLKAFEPGKKVAEDQPLMDVDIFPLSGRPVEAFLEKRGVDINVAMDNRWGMTKGGRLYIPIVENGNLMCWVARAVDDRQPKELSGPNRSHFFYGRDQAADLTQKLPPTFILVEGIFDQIHIKKWAPCLALMGSSISDIQIGKLMALRPAKVILMLDGDEAGRKATETIAAKLGKRMNPLSIRKIWLPESKDPDQITREEFEDLLRDPK